MYIDSTEQEKERILILSSKINEAYKVLKNKMARIKYILDLSKKKDHNKVQLDPMFLMEMMEVNEQIESLNETFDRSIYDSILKDIENIEIDLSSPIGLIENKSTIELDELETINILEGFYLKMKYILPIKEKLLTFAIQ